MIEKKIKFCLLLAAILMCSMTQVFSDTIILTSDQQLNDLLNPDKKIDLSTGHKKRFASLREVCEGAQKKGDHTLTIVFDEFFRQISATSSNGKKTHTRYG